MLVKAVADDAFRDYRTLEELLELEPFDDEMHQIHFKQDVLNKPFFEMSNGKIQKANSFGKDLRDFGFRAGYLRAPTIHDFRAEGLYLIGMILLFHFFFSLKVRQALFDCSKDETCRTARRVDLWRILAAEQQWCRLPRSQLWWKIAWHCQRPVRGLTIARNPELWQSLPAEKQQEVENTPEFISIEEELENLHTSDDPAAEDGRKILKARRRKSVSDALLDYQKKPTLQYPLKGKR